jgi:hypothetical protein
MVTVGLVLDTWSNPPIGKNVAGAGRPSSLPLPRTALFITLLCIGLTIELKRHGNKVMSHRKRCGDEYGGDIGGGVRV